MPPLSVDLSLIPIRPNLVTDLMSLIDLKLRIRYSSTLDAQNTLVLRRCLQLLNAILKEFASIKMPAGMKVMAEVPICFALQFAYPERLKLS